MKRELTRTGLAVAATAALGSLASSDVTSTWYARLDKPPIQPPGPVFGIVWTTLYTDIAVTCALALDRLRETDPLGAVEFERFLAANLFLNASWSWVFFKAHRLPPAVLVAGALALSSADLVRRVARVDRRAGLALAPYAIWCSFATVLSAALWRRNR
ncbi:MAG: tryptophan-rich sensory protein [Friedmanniella sp.]|nr:tryptophan-rich sensory protein [Friedmanniella sp.]